jgi:hypothetical protein
MKRTLLAVLLLACVGGCEGDPRWSVAEPSLDRVALSVWASAKDDVWAVGGALGSGGDALIDHFDGTRWSTIPTGTSATLWWVHGIGKNDLWMVGEAGTILHWDGTTLTPSPSGTSKTLYGIWGASDDDLWAVGGRPGQDGVILHFDGNAWTSVPVPVAFVAYFKVWGAAPNDVFVCGEAGTLVHFDGSAWAPIATGLPPSTTLFTVFGRSGSDVYTVGGFGRGVALHYDGAAATPVADPLLDGAGALAGVSVASDGTLLLVGAAGTKLRGKPGALVDDSAEQPSDDLHAAFFIGDEAYVVGGNYLAPAGAARHGVIGRFGR